MRIVLARTDILALVVRGYEEIIPSIFHIRSSTVRRRSRYCQIAVLLLGALSGCKEDVPETPVAPIINQNSGTRVGISDLYDVSPNVDNCSSGTLKQSERTKALNYVNAIRAIHGLPAVTYRTQDDPLVAKSSLIIAANKLLSHQPSNSLKCWSQEGYDGSNKSNLGISLSFGSGAVFNTTEQLMDMWWRDSSVAELGHRRWLLNPFLKYVAFGRVDKAPVGNEWAVTGSAIAVIHDEYQNLSGSSLEFVAYPFHEYPARLLGNGIAMSFSTIASRESFWDNGNVDYNGVSIEVREEGGAAVSVRDIGWDNQTYGLKNCLYWQANVLTGKRYNVKISGVRVNGNVKSFEYWFALQTTS